MATPDPITALDQRLAEHEDRLDDLENHYEGMAGVLDTIADLRDEQRDMRDEMRSLRDAVLRGFTGTQAVISRNGGRRGIDWKTVLAVISGVSIPIATAIIATGGGGGGP